MLPYRAWLTALDRARIDKAREAHKPPWSERPDFIGIRGNYVSEVAAVDAVVAVCQVIVQIVVARRPVADAERHAAITELCDQVIVEATPSSNTPLEMFAPAVYERLHTHDWWRAVQSTADMSAASPTVTATDDTQPTGDLANHLEWWLRHARWTPDDLAANTKSRRRGAPSLDRGTIEKTLERKTVPQRATIRAIEEALSKPCKCDVRLPVPTRQPRRTRRRSKIPLKSR